MKTSRFILPIIALALFVSAKRYKPTVFDLKYIEDNMVYIPRSSFVDGPSDEDVAYSQAGSSVVSVDSFYMSKFEMTNGFYLYYVSQLAKTDTAAYRKALPDTLVWRERLAYNEPYVIYYFRHPAYADYPLVGVSYEQAKACCEWLTKQYNVMPGRKYSSVTFDLPSKNQWMAAAKGGLNYSPYPWSGMYLRNKQGQLLANFMFVDEGSVYRKDFREQNVFGDSITNTYYIASGGYGDYMGVAGSLNDNADVTAPVNSYFPNDYKLYNMSGNVEEMVKEKGISKGGSWRDPGYYLHIMAEENYSDSTSTSSERGFRVMMTAQSSGGK